MLILSRRLDERIILDLRNFVPDKENPNANLIKLTLVDVGFDRAKIGLDAPRVIPMHREEIFKKIEEGRMQNEQQTTKDSKEGQVKAQKNS